MRSYLVGYDITEPKRLRAVHRLCGAYGMPLQRSLFLIWGNQKRFQQFLFEIERLITKKDDVRIYLLRENAFSHICGARLSDKGVLISALL